MAKKTDLPDAPAGQQFMFWLSEVAYRERMARGMKREPIAGSAGVSTNTVKRFENDGAGTHNTIAHLIAGYAKEFGMADGRELYRQAMDMWFAECDRPLTTATVNAAGPDGWLSRLAMRAERALGDDAQ